MPMEGRESETMGACCGRNRARERKREKKMDHWQVISLIDQSIRVYGQVKKTHSEKKHFFLSFRDDDSPNCFCCSFDSLQSADP